jgi:uncharacterized lipoprotein YddW (UPF0748 family)
MIGIALALSMNYADLPALPEPPREFRAAWVATVDNIDWPSKRGLPTQRQIDEMHAIFEKASELNLNAIILQIRPHADAMYDSKLEPWSEYLTGRQARAPQPYWDPLEYAVKEAHRRGIELHVWFNPYRAWHPAAKSEKSDEYIGKTNPELVKTYGRFEWMDPGEPKVQQRTLDVMMDVVKRYDIDGIHIDDYFYPYPIKDSDGKKVDFPDEPSWRRYVQSGGRLTRDDWRRKNVDDFIERIYTNLKEEKRWVRFGISPFGIYRPGVPEGIKAGVDQYGELYADARKWLMEGWCDYFVPQLYWPIKQTPQSFPVLLDWWKEQNPKGRHLWPGQFTSRTNPAEGNWNPQEVVDQINIVRDRKAGGTVHFSFKAFNKNWNNIAETLKDGPYLNPALAPASPWLDHEAPKPPIAQETLDRGTHLRFQWSLGTEDTQFFAIYALQGERWVWLDTTDRISIDLPKAQVDGKISHLAIRPIDRVGNLGTALIVSTDSK